METECRSPTHMNTSKRLCINVPPQIRETQHCIGIAPWKINMKPTNHPFRKENDLPNLHDYVPCWSSGVYRGTHDYASPEFTTVPTLNPTTSAQRATDLLKELRCLRTLDSSGLCRTSSISSWSRSALGPFQRIYKRTVCRCIYIYIYCHIYCCLKPRHLFGKFSCNKVLQPVSW